MADNSKISLKGIDNAAAGKGSFWKTVWQLVKFALVSGITFIIQIVLAYLLPLIFDHVTALLPAFLQGIFNPEVLFDTTTASGAKDFAKYVVDGVVTWGYVIPFFLSNLLANVYGFFQNRKTTFRSDAPWYNFTIYIVLMFCLILFSTWLQGAIYGALTRVDSAFLNNISRLIATLVSGFVQFLVLFPMEKFVLLKEKKEPAESVEDSASDTAVEDVDSSENEKVESSSQDD